MRLASRSSVSVSSRSVRRPGPPRSGASSRGRLLYYAAIRDDPVRRAFHLLRRLLVPTKRIKFKRSCELAEALHRGEALAERAQLEREARADLLELHLLGRAERVAVAPEEEEVALVVEGYLFRARSVC